MSDAADLPPQLERATQLALRLSVPDACVQFTQDLAEISFGDDEGALVILFLPECVELRHRSVEWPLPYAPKMGTLLWRRVPLHTATIELLSQLVNDAGRAWKRKLRRCVHCRERFPPGRRITHDRRIVCHECAQKHEHILF